MPSPRYNAPLHGFAVLTALATLGLIGMGGLVTSHRAGLAVPDWPTTYGYNMFFFPVSQWFGGIFYEHSHRLWASAVGLMTVVLAVWLHGVKARPGLRWGGVALTAVGVGLWLLTARRADGAVLAGLGLIALGASWVWPRGEPAPKWLRRLGWVAVGAVVAQGILGGLRVTLIRDELGIFHAALAQLFLVLMCALALFTSRWWLTLPTAVPCPHAARVRTTLLVATSLIFGQLMLGAMMRHEHAGLAIPDFPLAYGRLWPATDAESVARYNQQRLEVTAANPITAYGIWLQMAHRLGAVLVLGAVSAGVLVLRKSPAARKRLAGLATLWWGLVWLQGLLGAGTIWSNKAADIATAHVAVGAVLLVLGSQLGILSFRLLRQPVGDEVVSDPRGLLSPVSGASGAPARGA